MDIDFETLIELQDLDERIKEISLFLDKAPSRIAEIDQKIEDSIQVVSAAKDKLAKNQKKRRDLESNVQDKKNQIEKYRKQLNEVKTNREYTSLRKEIDDVHNEIEAIEEEIISEMLLADDIEAEIKSGEKQAAEAKDRLLREKDIFIQESRERETQRENLMSEKERILPGIPSDQIKLYDSIFRKNNGIALSPVTDDFCSMCQIRIRPQVINELIARNKIILCENCGRILYWEQKSA